MENRLLMDKGRGRENRASPSFYYLLWKYARTEIFHERWTLGNRSSTFRELNYLLLIREEVLIV